MSSDATITRRAFKQVWIGATVWALVFGGTVATSALSYVNSFPDQASRDQIARSTSSDAGLSILLGPVSAINTVGGYTVYKCFVFLTTIGALWGLLSATRLLRGEEDAGRWQLVLAGGTRATRATAATLVALAAAVAIVFSGTVLFTVLAGRNPDVAFSVGDSIFYGLSIAVAPAVFVAVGAVTSQLGRSRRVATGLATCVFGVAMVVRMIADSGQSTRWLLWLTPFGWIERMRPFTDPDARPLVVAAVSVVLLAAFAIRLVGRRDVGDGALATSDVAQPRPFGLRSLLGFATRMELPVLIAWLVGTTAAAFAFGIVARIATGRIPSSLGDTLDKFGVHGRFVDQYLGVAFLMIATIVALFPASQIGAAAQEEASGRLVQVLALPARRKRLLGGRLLLAAVTILVAGVVAGLAAWGGALTQGVDAGVGTMLRAGLNIVPTALLVLGVGAVVLAVAPRAATRAVYGVVIWSLLVDLLGSMVSGLAWLEHLSLFHYMALAPAEAADPTAIVITLVGAAVLMVVAAWLFARRDVQLG